MKKNLWKLLFVSSFCAVGLGLNNGEKVNAMQQNPLGNGAGAVEKTVEYSCADKKIISAAFVNDSENIKLSLTEEADIDVKDSLFNRTHLIWVTYHNNFDMVEFLVENGANVNAQDKEDITALMVASEKGNWEIFKFLVENGADVNAKDKQGRTALMIASEKGNWKIFYFLLENGRKVSAKDKQGRVALMSDFEEKNNGRTFFRISPRKAVINDGHEPINTVFTSD